MLSVDNKNLIFLTSKKKVEKNIFKIFDKNVCEFLDALSKEILKNKLAKKYADLITFAFWIRGGNLNKIKSKYISEKSELRLGHGLAFHITPSNIALNFAYSFALSLLAGNSNIIRVTNRNFDQVKIFFDSLHKVFKKKKFNKIQNSNIFVRYNYDEQITSSLTATCDCRIIWGSDKTVNQIKKIPTKATCKDLIFPDRYSMSLINFDVIKKLSKKNLKNLAESFYLDSMMFDQNACSSPHLIVWFGKKNEKIYKEFWKNVNIAIKEGKYFFPSEKNKFDKFGKLCEFAATRDEIKTTINEKFITRMILKKIPADIDLFRVGYGYFFEYFVNDFEEITKSINFKFQTMTYFGFKLSQLKDFVYKQRPEGIDRIVPIGRALEFSELWDGYDLIRNLSKVIDIK